MNRSYELLTTTLSNRLPGDVRVSVVVRDRRDGDSLGRANNKLLNVPFDRHTRYSPKPVQVVSVTPITVRAGGPFPLVSIGCDANSLHTPNDRSIHPSPYRERGQAKFDC